MVHLITRREYLRVTIGTGSIIAGVPFVACRAFAQDNPLGRKLLADVLTNALIGFDSKDNSFHSESSERKTEWAKVKEPITGDVIAKTKIGEWRESFETWVWFDDPKEQLAVQVSRFDQPKFVEVFVDDGHEKRRIQGPFGETITINVPRKKKKKVPNDRFFFEMSAKAKVACQAWGKIDDVKPLDFLGSVEGSISTTARARISIAGSLGLDNNGKCADADISKCDGELSDIRFKSKLGKTLQGPLIGFLANHFLDEQEKSLRKKIEKGIEGHEI